MQTLFRDAHKGLDITHALGLLVDAELVRRVEEHNVGSSKRRTLMYRNELPLAGFWIVGL